MKRKYSILGLIASVGCLILCTIFLFWNPYSTKIANKDTILNISIVLILPAILGIVASFYRNRILMFTVFFWSLPFALYMGVASIPSIFNFFIVVLIFYLISAVRMSKDLARL